MAISSRLGSARISLCTTAGIAAAFAVMPLLPALVPLFDVPGNGIGWVTVNQYRKGWDYAVLAILFATAAAIPLLVALSSRAATGEPEAESLPLASRRNAKLWTAIAVAAVSAAMLPMRDHPQQIKDPYHEGESLTPASVMMDGGSPYGDIFFMHGLATDGGIDLLAMAGKPSPVRARRAKAVLSALTLALLVPIAMEVAASWPVAIAAIVASICATGAPQIQTFPFFRLMPLLLAVWSVLAFLRTGRRWLVIAAAALASAGMVWSLDVGLFATAGFWGWIVVRRLLPARAREVAMPTTLAAAAATVLTPLILIAGTGGSVTRFFRDSFLRLPECFDAIYSLAAPPLPALSSLLTPAGVWAWVDSPSARYFMPAIVYGALLAAAFFLSARGRVRTGEAMVLIALTGFVQLRSAAGRVAWSHTRFAVPLLGIVLVVFVIAPLVRRRVLPAIAAAILTVLAVQYVELVESAVAVPKFYASYASRLRPIPGSVPFPVPRAADLYTYQQEADDTGALYRFSKTMPPGPIFEFAGEKDLYYLLERAPATRCPDVPYLADPALGREARRQLERRRPVFVVVKGHEILGQIDGISYRDRVPWLAEWIDENYPERRTFGRFVVALPSTAPATRTSS